jgi:hypothetical protein
LSKWKCGWRSSGKLKSQSYFTTGGLPPISSSWHQAFWGSGPAFFFFLQQNPYGHNPCVTSTLTRGWACLLWICLAFVNCTYRTYCMLLKIIPFTIYTSLLSVQALQCWSCLSCTIWDFHSGDYDEYHLLGYDAV